MQQDAAACNTEKLAALSAIAKLDRQIYEAQGAMAGLLAAFDSCCSDELQALEAQHGLLKVCRPPFFDSLDTCMKKVLLAIRVYSLSLLSLHLAWGVMATPVQILPMVIESSSQSIHVFIMQLWLLCYCLSSVIGYQPRI